MLALLLSSTPLEKERACSLWHVIIDFLQLFRKRSGAAALRRRVRRRQARKRLRLAVRSRSHRTGHFLDNFPASFSRCISCGYALYSPRGRYAYDSNYVDPSTQIDGFSNVYPYRVYDNV